MTRPDVLIAGAGPAGAIAALVLARAGVRVVMLDRALFPRDKLCGDAVNPGACAILRRLGLLEAVERRGLRIGGMVVTGPGGVEVRGDYGRGRYGLSVLRRELDWLLVNEASSAGVRFEPGLLVRQPIVDATGGRRRVTGLRVRSPGGAVHDWHAPLTIAADGRRSPIAFQLGLARHPSSPRRWAVGAYFEDAIGNEDCGEMHVRSGGYIGVAPVPGGLTNACVVVSSPRPGALAAPRAVLLAALRREPLLARRFEKAHLIGSPTVLGPLAVETAAAGAEGLLLAGDAAGFIDPVTGDGVRFAFRGAELAAQVALELFAGNVQHGPAELTRRRGAEFRRKWVMNRALRALVASPRAVACATAGARAYPQLLRHLIAIAGDVHTIEPQTAIRDQGSAVGISDRQGDCPDRPDC